MDKNNAVIPPTAAPAPEVAVPQTEDLEAKVAALEAEKSRLIEESANYKLGMLKAKGKIKENFEDEGEEDKVRRIMREEIANSRLAQINTEKDAVIARALKENKELKLASLNKATAPVAIGSHSESVAVQDSILSPDQLAAFKARGWNEKDIERYKQNLRKNSVR